MEILRSLAAGETVTICHILSNMGHVDAQRALSERIQADYPRAQTLFLGEVEERDAFMRIKNQFERQILLSEVRDVSICETAVRYRFILLKQD